jgi:hypothetical protein
MKKIIDTKIYLSIIIAPLVIAAAIGGISLYSKLIVEPKAKALISSEATMKEGYLILREPQIFGGYKYWDSDGMAVKNSLRYFDNKLFNGGAITPDERIYLELVLKRRISGSELGIKSAFFLILVSFTGLIALLIEKRNEKSI